LLGGIISVSVPGCSEYNVSVPEKNKDTFQSIYVEMKDQFKSATNNLQSIVTDEFYDEFGDWASGLDTDDEPLCKYFPLPAIRTTDRKGRSLDELVDP